MLLIGCPLCGESAATDFTYVDEADTTLEAATTLPLLRDSLYFRGNAKVSRELWHHSSGCRQLLLLERDREANRVISVCLFRAHASQREPHE